MALWYVCTLHSGLNSAGKTDSSGILEECGKNFEWISKPSGLPCGKSSLILGEDRRWLNLRKFFILAQISQKMSQTTIHQKRKCSGYAHFWDDLSQSEKLSQIKPPLTFFKMYSNPLWCSVWCKSFLIFSSFLVLGHEAKSHHRH